MCLQPLASRRLTWVAVVMRASFLQAVPAGPLVCYSVAAVLGRLSQDSMFALAAFLGCRLCRGTVAVLCVALWAAVFALLDRIMTRHRHVTRPRTRGRPCKLPSQLNRNTDAQEILPNPTKNRHPAWHEEDEKSSTASRPHFGHISATFPDACRPHLALASTELTRGNRCRPHFGHISGRLSAIFRPHFGHLSVRTTSLHNSAQN